MIFWMIVVISMIIYFAYGIRNYDKNDMVGVSQEISLPESLIHNQTNDSFDERLRKLEILKKEGLISSNEYQKKRTEIMNDKW